MTGGDILTGDGVSTITAYRIIKGERWAIL